MNTKINRRKHRRSICKLIEVAAVLAITAILLKVFMGAAYAERGYAAIGGEYCALFFPLFWCAAKSVVNDVRYGTFSFKDQER